MFKKLAFAWVYLAFIAAPVSAQDETGIDVQTAIEDLRARVDRLEGKNLTVDQLSGTYSWRGLQIGLHTGLVETIIFSGSLDLASDNTYVANLTEQKAGLEVNGSDQPTRSTQAAFFTGTWVLTGSRVEITIGGGPETVTFDVGAGGATLVGHSANDDSSDPSDIKYDRHLIVLTRIVE